MRRLWLTITTLVVLALAGCVMPAPATQTPAPAAVAPAPVQEAPTAVPAQAQAEALTANPWQWVSFTGATEQFEVAMPESYLLTFNEDGTVIIVADCNRAAGSYTDQAGSLTIEIGPATMALCPGDSRGEQFVTYLGSAARYFFQDGKLFIDLLADGGTLAFAPAKAELMADDGEGALAGAIWANPWQWVSFTGATEQFEVAMPESYLLTFNEDGTVIIVADCNRAAGSYTDQAGSLTIEIGPATMALCPGDSRGEQFVTYLGSAARYFFQDGKLFIDLLADGGTLAFAPAAAQAEAPAASGTIQSAPFSATALMNATYSGIYDEPVTLTEGLFEGQPFVAGDPARPTVHYGAGSERYGDLDGDGVPDAIVILIERGGGTGAFSYIAAQLNRDGQPVDAGAVRIEDRIGVKSAAIVGGQVMLEVIMQGPGDAACCGSHKTLKTYALQDGRLAEISREGETLEKISAADLDGTTWTLVELNYEQPALADAEITATFQEGRVSGSGGCNNYNASATVSDANPFVVTFGPVASTKMMCPDAISNQEAAYFTALGTVGSWGYVYGRLAFFYVDGHGESGRLLFAAPGMPELAPPPTEDLTLIRDHPWQWVSFAGATEQFDVAAPESYQLTFNADGTVAIVADCNLAQGSYKTDQGSLAIAVGPATLALCPGNSRSEQFVKYLGFAARYFFRDGKLFIDLLADGGTLAFAPAD